jgi:hypothetical protein
MIYLSTFSKNVPLSEHHWSYSTRNKKNTRRNGMKSKSGKENHFLMLSTVEYGVCGTLVQHRQSDSHCSRRAAFIPINWVSYLMAKGKYKNLWEFDEIFIECLFLRKSYIRYNILIHYDLYPRQTPAHPAGRVSEKDAEYLEGKSLVSKFLVREWMEFSSNSDSKKSFRISWPEGK